MADLLYAQANPTTPIDTFNEGRNNALLGRSISAAPQDRNGLLGQVAMTYPKQALAFQGALQTQDDSNEDRRNKTLVNMSKLLVSAPDAYKDQIYQQIRPSLAKLGLTQAPPNYNDEIGQTAKSIVDAYTPLNAQPSGVREFNAMAQNLSPEDRKRAERINLGLDARAVTGAAKTGMITGADGRERPYVFDPSTQGYKVFDGQAFRPLDQTEASQLGGQAAAPQASVAATAQQTPEQLMATATQMANKDGPGSHASEAQAWLTQQLASQGRLPTPASGQGALGVSRAPEETAGAVQNAKNASDLQYLPQQEAIKTNAAITQAGGSAAATNAAKNAAEQGQAFQQRQADARKTLSDLDEVDQLLPKATGGAFGRAVDTAAASVNHSTDTAKASAQLDILAGRLTSAVPRMQGPQSDRDVELYQKQAGDLANRSLPIATRQAAAKELRRLQMKYLDNPYGNGSPTPAGQVQAPTASAVPAPQAQRAVNPQTGHAVVWNGSAWVAE